MSIRIRSQVSPSFAAAAAVWRAWFDCTAPKVITRAGPLRQRLAHQELELARLVAAGGQPRAIVALDVEGRAVRPQRRRANGPCARSGVGKWPSETRGKRDRLMNGLPIGWSTARRCGMHAAQLDATYSMTADIIVQDREELIFLLCEAAEFEHAVMCTYLYAMWSLKRDEGEGVTRDELAAIERWRASLRQVAREEMLHLCLVNNLLSAFGAAPHLWKPEFPVRPGHFPADVVMRLTPVLRTRTRPLPLHRTARRI